MTALGIGKSRERRMSKIEIVSYKEVSKGALQGFLTVLLPSSLEIRDMTHFKKGDNEWFNMPQREYEKDGERKYYAINHYNDPEIRDRFMSEVAEEFKKWKKGETECEPQRDEVPF